MAQPLRILFVCDGSAARSQMAAGLRRQVEQWLPTVRRA